MTDESVGKPLDRVDGRLKVTGGARYSAEMPVANVAHGVLIMSTIAKGRIAAMDTQEAQSLPGVRLILTPFNATKLPAPPAAQPARFSYNPAAGLSLLQDDRVYYNNQPIGVAVADTLEQATAAARLVRVRYDEETPVLDLQRGEMQPRGKYNRGDVAAGRTQATTAITPVYSTPMENHNPMEPHATIAVWEASETPGAPARLTVYDSTQGIFGVRGGLAQIFGLPPDNVRCVAYFVGGGFGCKGRMWSQTPLCAMAAQQAGRPVKLALTRAQMFGMVGYRPETDQHLMLGADAAGHLTALSHDVTSNSSTFDDFVEQSSGVTRMMYACPNVATSQTISRLDTGTPTYMRAPGESTGTWVLEAAMDELAVALKMDPIALRLNNYTETDPESGKPWSGKMLRECYRVGAERFGWARRQPTSRSMRTRDGRLIGMGVGTATYPARRGFANALARLLPDGTAYVMAGTQDIGTGTYTIMTQIAADALGLPPERVRFELGDTRMPQTPGSGGSTTAATTGSAVRQAGLDARAAAIAKAVTDPASPLNGLQATDVDVQNGRMFAKSDPTRGEEYAALVRRSTPAVIEAQAMSRPGPEAAQYSGHSFGAAFAEVLVDPDLGEIRVSRLTGVYGVGTILNAKTGRSQLIGGMVWGVGMALMEQTMLDPRFGRAVNRDLAEYHVPVCADIPTIDVAWIDEPDLNVDPLGAKGIGEIGITGVVAAIGNAVYHATGVRVRDLPITLDKVLKAA
jgi:xanthine dehydrogenase YagR molybdenum-binding subunit